MQKKEFMLNLDRTIQLLEKHHEGYTNDLVISPDPTSISERIGFEGTCMETQFRGKRYLHT